MNSIFQSRASLSGGAFLFVLPYSGRALSCTPGLARIRNFATGLGVGLRRKYAAVIKTIIMNKVASGFVAGPWSFLPISLVVAGVLLARPSVAPVRGQPTELGQTVNGFQDDFTSAVRNPNWVAVGPGGDHYEQVPTYGVLRVTTSGGGSNHLLYMAPGASNSVQEVLARIWVVKFGTGEMPRAGVCAGVNTNVPAVFKGWNGINLQFRDNAADGPPSRHFNLLDDAGALGPQANIVWTTDDWYWLRLRIDPKADGTNDYFAKIWAANDATPEPAAWQLKWSEPVVSKPRHFGWAGITASNYAALSEYLISYILIKSADLPSIKVNFCPTSRLSIRRPPRPQNLRIVGTS
jgi:hypothetical protein